MSTIKSIADTLATALAHVMKLSIIDREFYINILQRTLESAPYVHGLWVVMEDRRAGSGGERQCLCCWKSVDGILFKIVTHENLQQIEKLCSVIRREQLTRTVGPSDDFLGDSTILAATAAAPIHLDGVYSGVAAVVVSLDQLAEHALTHADQALNDWMCGLEMDLGCGLILFGNNGKALASGSQGRSHLKKLNDKGNPRSLIKQHSMPHLHLTWVVIKPVVPRQKISTRIGVSNREYQLLPLLALGKSNDEIASTLSISSNTVKNHLDKIFKKIGVSNRHAAAVWWQQRQSSGLFNT